MFYKKSLDPREITLFMKFFSFFYLDPIYLKRKSYIFLRSWYFQNGKVINLWKGAIFSKYKSYNYKSFCEDNQVENIIADLQKGVVADLVLIKLISW